MLLVCVATSGYTATLYSEASYRDAWCVGQTEVRLNDGTRADCVTTNYAIEIDFAHKWAEGIGQSLHYARLTNKAPAVLLILEKESDWRYYHRAMPTAQHHNIKLWYITPRRLQ